MKTKLLTLVVMISLTGIQSCIEQVTSNPPEKDGFKEVAPVTTIFSEAETLYNGDDIGEAVSDGWIIKLHTEMEIDGSGAPIGPGCVLQLLLNVPYNEKQEASLQLLAGTYSEMSNSGDFSPHSFVNGYMASISIPGGEKIDIADATFYADVEKGGTGMDYDLIDEGFVEIKQNDDGTFTISGTLVGNKYTKRNFIWTGMMEPKDNAPQEIPNSTLKHDIEEPGFTKGQLQDKGDSFYLQDESYRCLLLYLAEETVDLSMNRPAGSGAVLRAEILVDWETDIEEGIPAGTYTMVQRNADTSIDRDRIVPGAAIAGLPNVFEAWKLSGTWYYGLENGVWTDTYARISDGSITVERGDDGSHTISYNLYDCQKNPKKISGTTTLKTLTSY